MTDTMKNREAYLDQLRALAIFAVVCCHISADVIILNPEVVMHSKTFFATLLFNSGRFIGVPIFVMLSGALLINKKYSLSVFVKKRFNRVFVPFIFWVIVYIVFSVVVQEATFKPKLVYNVFFAVRGATAGTILWFIWMLIFVYIGIFIINKILEYAKSKSYERACINLLVIASLIFYVIYNSMNFKFETILYYCSFIPYAVFGYYLTHTDFTNSLSNFKVNPKRIVIITFILAVLSYLYFVSTIFFKSVASNKFVSGSYFDFIVLILSFSIILFFRYLPKSEGAVSKRINAFLTSKNISKAILSISLCSYGIYFIHILILVFLEKKFLNQIGWYNHPLFWVPILVVGIFLASWFIIWVMSKIPYINRISGAS